MYAGRKHKVIVIVITTPRVNESPQIDREGTNPLFLAIVRIDGLMLESGAQGSLEYILQGNHVDVEIEKIGVTDTP